MLITIEVTPDIATKIRFMAESGVFAIQNGSATIHFKEGVAKTIKSELYTYAPSLSTGLKGQPLALQSQSPIL